MQSSFIGPQVTWDLHASLALILVQENCEERRKPKPSRMMRKKRMVETTKAANKKQKVADQQAAKATREASKGKEAANALHGYEMSNALLICTHETGDALQTTMYSVAALQETVPVRRGTGGMPGQRAPK